jgi:uncharacterized protein YggE
MFKKIVAIAALLLAPLAAAASQLPEYPFIHMTGNAKQYIVPDSGAIDFEVIAADADPAAARKVVEDRVAEVRALVEAQGLAPESLEVHDVRQELRKNPRGDAPAVYEVKCVVHIDVHEMSKWAALAGGLLGMQNLDAFATAFDTSERDKIEADLGAQAVRDAQRKADALAKSFGRKLGPPSAVTTGALKNLGNAMGLVNDYFSSRGGRSGQGQRVERENLINVVAFPMSLSVDVIFRLK